MKGERRGRERRGRERDGFHQIRLRLWTRKEKDGSMKIRIILSSSKVGLGPIPNLSQIKIKTRGESEERVRMIMRQETIQKEKEG